MSDIAETPKPQKRPRGFAAISPEERSRISSLGGKAAHAAGTAHEFTSEEGREAGRRGGRETGRRKREKKEPIAPTDAEPKT